MGNLAHHWRQYFSIYLEKKTCKSNAMTTKQQYKYAVLYAILKHYVNFCFKLYAGKLEVRGKENIPADGVLIFAPNHQNALLDALAVVYIDKGQTMFVARADIFKKVFIAKLLYFLKILPVFRIRDGFSNLNKNAETFDKISNTMANGNSLGIMPEGNHNEERRLRLLSKGIFRIAFEAQEKLSNEGKKVYIIPIGINYGEYDKCGSGIFIQAGKAIDIKAHLDSFRAEPQKTMSVLRETLKENLSGVMIDIKSELFYESIYTLSRMLCRSDTRPSIFFDRQKACTNLLNNSAQKHPEYFESLHNAVVERNLLFREQGISTTNENMLESRNILFIKLYALLLGLPLFLYGALNHILIIFTTSLIVKKIKDPQFISSVKLAGGVLLAPFFYILQSFAVLMFFHSAWAMLVYFFTLLPTGWIAGQLYIAYKDIFAQFRRYKYFRKQQNLATLESQILKTVQLFLKP
jgi:1-acyl-sn-glycerol-3-phosphate acyltransferase